MSLLRSARLCVFAVAFPALTLSALAQQPVPTSQNAFHASTDIGKAQHGSTAFDAAAGIYRIAGGGADVWGAADDFRFTWVKVSGNAALSADVNVAQPSTYPKAKGMLMFRQSLDPGSPYADISLHADGHITLAWRAVQGGPTKDTDLPEHGSVHLRIVREGNQFTAYASSGAGETTAPPSITIPMPATVFVGLGVCSHDTNALQTVTFSGVAIAQHGVRAEILPAAQ